MRGTPGQVGREPLVQDAVDLLRRVLAEIPKQAFTTDTHARIVQWLSGATAVEPSEAPTVSERRRVRAVTMTARQHHVLQHAQRSPRLRATFGDLHAFLLSAARGYHYLPAPDFPALEVPPGTLGKRAVAFTRAELAELELLARESNAPTVDEYVVGCAFAWLATLQAKWPDDVDLNPQGPASETNHVPVVRFFPKG